MSTRKRVIGSGVSADERSPFLRNLDDGGMGSSDEEAMATSDSAEDILTSGSSKTKKWSQFLCLPIRTLFPSSVFVKFFLASIIPALSQQLIPLFYTGQIPNQSSLALAGQFTFISIVLEVLEEGIVNSLFHFVGKNYKQNRSASLGALKLCFILLIGFGTLLAAVILSFTKQFVSIINTPADIVENTINFLWISSFSFPLILLNSAIKNFLFITTSPLIISVQIVQVIGTFLLNFFMFGQGSWSLQWGINELGTYRVIQSGLNLVINLIFFHWIERMSPKYFWWDISLRGKLADNLAALFAVSWGNFGDSALRNFFYFVVTLKFINSLGTNEIGAWNLMNTVIFGLVLLPMTAVASLVKVLIGHGAEMTSLKAIIKTTAKDAFFCLTGWTILVSLISYIFWRDFAAFFSQSNEEVQELSAVMYNHVGWTFVVYAYNTVLDSLFYGTGKTVYVFYQSLGTNLLVYLVPWILYETGVIFPSYWMVVSLYMAGMVVDFSFTLSFCLHLWNKIPN